MPDHVVRTPGSQDPAAITVAGEYADTHGYVAQRVRFDISAPGACVLVALVLRSRECGRFARLHRHHASDTAHLHFQVHYEWEHPYAGRMFTISFGQHAPGFSSGIQLHLDAGRVEGAPRDKDLIRFEPHATLPYGVVARLAEVVKWGVSAEVFVVPKSDTARSHGRWSVPKAMADRVPAEYEFLLTGRSAGDL